MYVTLFFFVGSAFAQYDDYYGIYYDAEFDETYNENFGEVYASTYGDYYDYPLYYDGFCEYTYNDVDQSTTSVDEDGYCAGLSTEYDEYWLTPCEGQADCTD